MGFGISKIIKSLSPITLYQLYRKRKILLKNRNKDLILGLGCGVHNVDFGKHVYVGSNVSLANVTIGNHSYINSGTIIRDTVIGSFCSIASNVKIVMGSHPTNLISTHPAFYANNKGFITYADKTYFQEYFPVEIGNDVWIGEEVMIPGGIKIGDGAIIASRAVVTKDVEPYSIVGGVPAKFIKYRFNTKEIEWLLKYKWWNKNEDWIKIHYRDFLNPQFFFKK